MVSCDAHAIDELVAALNGYADICGNSRLSGAPTRRQEVKRPKAPRTHLHAEMVRKRKDPQPSDKSFVQEALLALNQGDTGAVEALLARAGEEPVPEEWQTRYKDGGQMFWDHFYRERTVNFFKDRNYLREEFGELMPADVLADPRRWVDPLAPVRQTTDGDSTASSNTSHTVLLEVGCAVGNGVLPMLRASPGVFAYACDLSPVAVQLLKEKEEYQCGRCLAFACDVTKGEMDQPTSEHSPIEKMIEPATVDFATLLFVISAIDPTHHRAVYARIRSRLRPGGVLMIRDYGRGDLAQLRFAPGHWLGGDLYVRGDGTLAYFLTAEGLAAQLEAVGFEVIVCEYRKHEIVNRSTGVRMPRVWVQGKFRRRD